MCTTSAAVHEASCTEVIHQALVDKDLPPTEHLVDGAYIDAELLLTSQQAHGITLRGPTRPIQGWQTHVEGAYTVEHFAGIGSTRPWCVPRAPPPTVGTSWWREMAIPTLSSPSVRSNAVPAPCARSVPSHASRAAGCGCRPKRSTRHSRRPGPGIPVTRASSTISAERGRRHPVPGGAGLGLRRTRYRGLAKTHLQHVATAAAINVDRIVAWLDERPRATTRTSRFAALAPLHALSSGTPSV